MLIFLKFVKPAPQQSHFLRKLIHEDDLLISCFY